MTSNSRNYFRSQLPSWSTLQTALAVFALVVIFRSCVQRLYSWSTRASGQSHPSQQEKLPDNSDQCQTLIQADWAMDENRRKHGLVAEGQSLHVSFDDAAATGRKKFAADSKWKLGLDTTPRPLMSRPPPAPPLTPPELSTAIFTYEERPRSQQSFIHQPNPDYMSSSPAASTSQSGSASPMISRRRSYNKTLPVGIPVPQSLLNSNGGDADLTTSPNSYPPTSPLLPPAPPGFPSLEDGIKGTNIDVRGEIISMLDRDGAGWSRHTRVYGGGVCLACAASGGEHGGFYGATVSPEEMR